ncbi:Opsin-VA [Labeo rohita]|uniref:Opsin-VA n=1 Tax=Labeo rohita TaxID=84645 RepID=A0ABQ8M752_LABRO|nr:Opsin-VA [Labeo rohita]
MPALVAVMESFGSSVTESTDITTPDDPFSGPLKSVAPWNYTFLACLMFIVTSLSITENFTVMLVTLRFKQLRKPLNYIIVNLSVADFLVSMTGGTISFLTNARGYFFLGVWACVLEGFAVTFFGIVALWSLAILAFERYFVICRPLKNVRLGGKHAAMGLVFVWTFSFIWTIPPVLGWNSYTVSKIGTTCEPNCKLMQKLRKVSNTHGRLGNARKPDREVARMVIVMIVAFMVGWTPYAAFSIIVTACPTIYIDPRLGSIPAFFSKTAAVYNPIIYVFMNKQFRKCLIQMFKGNVGNLDSTNLNQTSDKGATAESHIGEMSTIAARVPMSMCNMEKSEDEEEESEQSGNGGPKQLQDSRVCPL